MTTNKFPKKKEKQCQCFESFQRNFVNEPCDELLLFHICPLYDWFKNLEPFLQTIKETESVCNGDLVCCRRFPALGANNAL